MNWCYIKLWCLQRRNLEIPQYYISYRRILQISTFQYLLLVLTKQFTMLSPRIDLGIAQIVFYVPFVPIAIFLFIRNWKYRPRMAWWPMVPLTLMRLAGGIITIVFEKRPSIGLYIAAIILLNVGAIPLIVATLGQIRIILIDNYSHSPWSTRIAKGIRLSFVGAVALLVAGGALSSVSQNTSRILSLVGYIVFAVVLGVLIAMELWFFWKRSELIPHSQKVRRHRSTPRYMN